MATPTVSPDDLAGAMNGLRGEIPGIVAPLVAGLRGEITSAFKDLHDRSLVEINTQITVLKDQVEATRQATVAEIQRVTGDKLEAANAAFVAEQARLTTSVTELQRAIDTVGQAGQGDIAKFSELLAKHDAATVGHTKIVADSVHQLLRSQLDIVDQRMTDWSTIVNNRLDGHDAGLGAVSGSSGVGGSSTSQPRGGRYDLRVPDPKQWQLDMLKDGTHGFVKWRKTFDLQVNSVWNGLDAVLEGVRAEKQPIDKDVFETLLSVADIKPAGASELDWAYRYMSTKLYMVIYTHCDVDPIKIIEEGDHKCGFEAYRLLSKAYDLYNENDEVLLLNHVLQISQWAVKGINQAESMMREAKTRIAAWEKRTKHKVEVREGMLITFTTMLFGKLDVPTAKDVLAHAGKESKVKVDFEILKKTVEEIKLIEGRSKPTPMDLGAVHNHISYVQAQDGSEGQEEWPEEDPNAWYEGCAQDE